MSTFSLYSDPDNPFGAKSKRKRLLADRIWIFGPKPFSFTLYRTIIKKEFFIKTRLFLLIKGAAFLIYSSK